MLNQTSTFGPPQTPTPVSMFASVVPVTTIDGRHCQVSCASNNGMSIRAREFKTKVLEKVYPLVVAEDGEDLRDRLDIIESGRIMQDTDSTRNFSKATHLHTRERPCAFLSSKFLTPSSTDVLSAPPASRPQ